MHSFPISLRAFTSVFFQARHMGEALPCHARDCMGCRAWWFDCSKHYSILRLDMPHRDNANPDAPHKQHRLAYSSQAFLSPHYLTWTASPVLESGTEAGRMCGATTARQLRLYTRHAGHDSTTARSRQHLYTMQCV